MPHDTGEKDARLRAAAFEALRRLTEPTGGVITREQMNAGFDFQGDRIPFANPGRGIWRPKILGEHGSALSVVTSAPKPGRPAPYDDGAENDQGWLAYRYQRKGADTWDNAALRRAHQLNLPIIYFNGVIPGVFSAVFPAYVVADEKADRTFRLASVGVTVEDVAVFGGGDSPLVKSYMLQVVKRRLHQHKFREFVVTAYGRRCTVCRLRHDELLDAAHILQDRDERGKPEVQNGLALCKIHHAAYDANILGISPEYLVHINPRVLNEEDGPMLLHGIQQMDGAAISVPTRAHLKPNRDYLGERFAAFQAA